MNYQHSISEKSLEWITYYPNMDFPQFTPINYYLYFYRKLFYDGNPFMSIILSQILPLFQDYNIPLVGNDILLFVNPDDNIANGLEIERCNYIETTDPYLLRQKQYWQECYECFDWLYNQLLYGTINIDELIKREIVERYKYNFNKEDVNNYQNFRLFLSETVLNKKDPNKEIFEKSSSLTLQRRMLKYYHPKNR